MALNPSSFKTTTALEDFSIRAANELTDYIADEVFTPIIVNKEAVKVYQYDGSAYKVIDSRKDSKAQADSIDYGVFTTNRTALLHKLRSEWDPADADQFDGVVANVEQDCAATIMDGLMLYKEVEAATAATTTTNYPSSLTATLGATETWIVSGGDPFGTSSTARAAVKTACGKAPTAAALSWTTFEKLRGSPIFMDHMKYTKTSASEEEFKALLKSWLGVRELAIGAAQKLTNIEGAADVKADVWSDGILFYVKNPAVTPKVMRYGANYVYNSLYTVKGEDPLRGSGKGRIQTLEMGMSYVLAAGAVVSSSDTDFNAGYYLSNVV